MYVAFHRSSRRLDSIDFHECYIILEISCAIEKTLLSPSTTALICRSNVSSQKATKPRSDSSNRWSVGWALIYPITADLIPPLPTPRECARHPSFGPSAPNSQDSLDPKRKLAKSIVKRHVFWCLRRDNLGSIAPPGDAGAASPNLPVISFSYLLLVAQPSLPARSSAASRLYLHLNRPLIRGSVSSHSAWHPESVCARRCFHTVPYNFAGDMFMLSTYQPAHLRSQGMEGFR